MKLILTELTVVVILGRIVEAVVITVVITGSITAGGLIAANRPYAHSMPWKHINNTYLTLKAPITTEADDIHKYYFYCFSEKIRLDVSS